MCKSNCVIGLFLSVVVLFAACNPTDQAATPTATTTTRPTETPTAQQIFKGERIYVPEGMFSFIKAAGYEYEEFGYGAVVFDEERNVFISLGFLSGEEHETEQEMFIAMLDTMFGNAPYDILWTFYDFIGDLPAEGATFTGFFDGDVIYGEVWASIIEPPYAFAAFAWGRKTPMRDYWIEEAKELFHSTLASVQWER